MDTQILDSLASRLGIQSSRVRAKSKELLRLLDVQGGSSISALGLSFSAKCVFCLDIAARLTGNSVQQTDFMIKLSGLKKRIYLTTLSTVENILGLQNDVSMQNLCVQFGCSEAQKLAEKLLQSYESSLQESLAPSSRAHVDLTHPRFKTAAVLAACKHLKIPVDRKKVYDVGRVKRQELDDLVTKMTEFVPLVVGNMHGRKRKRPQNLMEAVEEKLRENEEEKVESKENTLEKKDDYLEWKRKILEAAKSKKEQ